MTRTSPASATDEPTLRVISLGAGVQSSALAVLSARGDLPRADAAVFSDTGWEPAAVYAHLDRLDAEVLAPAGIPLHRVRATPGGLRADALDASVRYRSLPLYVRNPDGSEGRARRQCTRDYKLTPLKAQVRALLGASPRQDGVPGRVPRGRWAQQWVGISLDERDRALGPDGELNAGDVSYSRLVYPLLDLQLTRAECEVLLAHHGFDQVPKSACVGCPFHTNAAWRRMRDERPQEWADAVAFDAAMRHGSVRAREAGQPLRGTAYLHRSRVPLDEAPVGRVTGPEWAARQGDFAVEAQLLAFEESLDEDGRAVVGCSPFACRAE